MRLKFLKSIYKNLRPGFTLMLIPNASHKKSRNCHIPFILALFIIIVILVNIYIFVGYSAQVWQITHFKQKISGQQIEIAKLTAEKTKIAPVLEKDRQIETKFAISRQQCENLIATWKRINRKDRDGFLIASRGGFWNKNKTSSYRLTSLPKADGVTTSLEKLDHNLTQLDTMVDIETKNQQNLLAELQAYEYKLDHTPSIWPVYTGIRSIFGKRYHPIYRTYKMHQGVDLKAGYGTKVRAAASGKISFAGWEGGYGYLVKVQHDYGYETRYGHLSKLLTHTGQTVKKGQIVALSGNTGGSTGPHLHYEVRVNGNPVNPVRFLKD